MAWFLTSAYKPVIRYSKDGYRWLAMTCKTGTYDIRTGETKPDAGGATERRIYVGPFKTFCEAFAYADAQNKVNAIWLGS